MPLESSRDLALRIVRELAGAGYVAYWVGGCVRDQLLGLIPKDYDVATSAVPEVVLGLFRGSTLVGASFGVVLVPGGVEVATFRSEMNYEDGRRPEQVLFETEASRDALRRDFTINALYYDPLRDEVIDFVGGQADLQAGVIRAIGDARERFAEDHLRLLRAVRFSSRFRYEIEAGTFEALREMAPKIRRIAEERIHDEMRRVLTGPNLELAWRYLSSSGLWEALVPEAPRGERLAKLGGGISVGLGWAALLDGVADPREIFRRFRFSREEAYSCQDLLESERCFAELDEMSVAELKRFLRKLNLEEHFALHRATYGESSSLKSVMEMQRRWTSEELWPEPLLDGRDLIELGLVPGPEFGSLLRGLEDAQLEGRVQTREAAVELVLSQSGRDVHSEGR